jgi:hypothetical protein
MPIQVNFSKAQDITKERPRADRTPLLEEQDIIYMKAPEAGSETSAIVAEKQRLRDITNQVDDMTTLDELKTAKVEK